MATFSIVFRLHFVLHRRHQRAAAKFICMSRAGDSTTTRNGVVIAIPYTSQGTKPSIHQPREKITGLELKKSLSEKFPEEPPP